MLELAQKWYRQNKFDPSVLPDIYDKLYFEGEQGLRKLTNYVVMLMLATVISTYGITSDSTATVIGAMLVAPLMSPILAMSHSIVRGQLKMLREATRSAVNGIVLAIAVAVTCDPTLPIYVSEDVLEEAINDFP